MGEWPKLSEELEAAMRQPDYLRNFLQEHFTPVGEPFRIGDQAKGYKAPAKNEGLQEDAND